MVKNNPYQAYKQQSVMTMTPGDMLTAVYDGLLKELNFVQAAFAAKDYSEINRRCQKAQRLLQHLQSSLDFKYEISNNLNNLYHYFIRVMIQINVKKDPAGLEDIIQMISDLRETYVQADKKARSGESSVKSA